MVEMSTAHAKHWDSTTGKWVPTTPSSGGGAVATKSYQETIEMTAPTVVVTHGLGTKDVMVSVIDLATMENVGPNVPRISDNEISIEFGSVYPSSIRVLVLAL